MSLSDACFDFLSAVNRARSSDDLRSAARELQDAVNFYSKPPFRYGEEIDAVRRACADYLLSSPSSHAVDEPLRRISFVCEAIKDHLDMPPGFTVRSS